MKKRIALLLCVVFCLGMAAGCGAGADNGLSLTLLVAGSFGDSSFYDSARAGCDRLAAEEVQVTEVECFNEEHTQQIRSAAETSDIVVLVGWDFYEVETVAPEYPQVKFIWVDNKTSAPVENVLNITYAQNEGSFLAGYIAAKMSKTGIIGTVAGMDNVTLNDFVVGYEQGAQYADPDVQVEVSYANTYDNPEVGRACALAMYKKGADVIYQVAAQTGNGVFAAAREKGFWAIGVDSDQKYLAEDVIICSMCKQVGQSIYDAVLSSLNGNADLWGTTWVADMASGLVGISYGEDGSVQQIPDELKTEVEALSQKIISGEIQVETTRQ